MMKIVTSAVLALGLGSGFAVPAQAGGKFGSPPPDAHLAAKMAQVLGRAQGRIGKPISRGVILTAATSQGNTVIFMARAESRDAALVGMLGDPSDSLQERFVYTFGRKFCSKGQGTRRFVDDGGAISIALRLRGKVVAGGKLTKC